MFTQVNRENGYWKEAWKKHFFGVLDTKFVSATNVACAGKQGNICVHNNVSATMFPRLPRPLEAGQLWVQMFPRWKEDNDKCMNESV